MAGELLKTKGVFVPAPIDGLNLIASPVAFLPTEARELTNYYVRDWGIEERGAQSKRCDYFFPLMFPYTSVAGNRAMLGVSDEIKVRRFINSSDTTPADITGAVVITDVTEVNAFSFNKRIFFMNSVDVPWYYDLVAGTLNTSSFTGPAGLGAEFRDGMSFKGRPYFLEELSGVPSRVWYPNTVGAVSGALASIDFAEFMNSPTILKIFPWGYNQGETSSQLFVVLGVSGEVLFYSGDYPGSSTDWALVSSSSIPRPVGAGCVLKYGQEILISTERGLIPLSEVFAGRKNESDSYYSVSKKLGTAGRFNSRQIAIDEETPFLYGSMAEAGTGGDEDFDLYVQNYERAAWSKFRLTRAPQSMACFDGFLFFSTNSGGPSSNLKECWRIEKTGGGENSGVAATQLSWKTPYYNFLSTDQASTLTALTNKIVRWLRVVAATLSGSIVTKVSCSANFSENGNEPTEPGLYDQKTGTDPVIELAPPGVGERISFAFVKTPAGERNTLYGFQVAVDEGGAY